MNRRDFLHALGAIGAVSLPTGVLAGMLADVDVALPGLILNDGFSTNQAILSDLRVGIIGIGGAACGMLPKIYSQLPAELVPLTRTLAIDTSQRALRHSQGERQILLHAGRRPDNPQSAAVLTNVERTTIEQAVAGMHLAVILVGMGGTAGSGLTPVVADIAHQQGIATVVAAVLPFEWEGPSRTRAAHDACSAILAGGKTDALFRFSNDVYANACGEDATLLSVLDQARIHFSSLYRTLVMPIAVPGLVGFDLEDLRYILSRPGLSACADAVSLNDDNPLETCTRAVNQPWLGEQRLRSASAVLVNIKGTRSTLTIKRYRDISRFMREQCSEDAELFITMAQRETPGVPFRLSVLASGIAV